MNNPLGNGMKFSKSAPIIRTLRKSNATKKRMGEFRNLPAEDAAILATLGLSQGSHILEIGTGSGHFARAAARAGYRVTALDVSPAMLRYAEDRAKSENLTGVEFHHAGFLTFTGASATFDAAVSVAVLHHLPDLWKSIALQNIHRVLKPGGKFLLCDVVFSSKDRNPSPQFTAFIHAVPAGMRKATIGHVAKEYSTLDWIMKGLLERARLPNRANSEHPCPIDSVSMHRRPALDASLTLAKMTRCVYWCIYCGAGVSPAFIRGQARRLHHNSKLPGRFFCRPFIKLLRSFGRF